MNLQTRDVVDLWREVASTSRPVSYSGLVPFFPTISICCKNRNGKIIVGVLHKCMSLEQLVQDVKGCEDILQGQLTTANDIGSSGALVTSMFVS